MYALARRLITEKDLKRKIILLESLVNHPQLTAKELAKQISATQRTVFNDIQSLRLELPTGWTLEADGANGFVLTSAEPTTLNDIWTYFMEDSISIQLIKALLSTKGIKVLPFIQEQGISFETLKRHVAKLNLELASFQLGIQLTSTEVQWQGAESSIRIFYHRLLVPFTHNNFFFADYSIHQANYTDFLQRLARSQQMVNTEQIFGTCWFFINTIRGKANCSIESFPFDTNDALFQQYQQELTRLYKSEGIHLEADEQFFAFFCFLESWNYSAMSPYLKNILEKNYPELIHSCAEFVERIARHFHQVSLVKSTLQDNLVLFFLKYYESKQLSDKFLLEYQEVLSFSKERFPELYQLIGDQLVTQGLLEQLPHSNYAVNIATLLVQEALYATKPQQKTAYFLFQGEPAWKNFLFRELQDLLGNRVCLTILEDEDFVDEQLEENDFILSNYPLSKQISQPIIYISTIPTQNELVEIKEFIQDLYI